MYVVVPRPQDDNGAARNLTFLEFPLCDPSIEVNVVKYYLTITEAQVEIIEYSEIQD